MYELFTANTPNGVKIPIALEEVGAPYVLRIIPLGSAEMKSAEFARINPNLKIPAARYSLGDAGEDVTIFESGAILLDIAERNGALRGDSDQARAQTLSWLFLQVAGLGPAMGQTGHFRSLTDPDPYALERFRAEAGRLLKTVEARVASVFWLNGESYSIADIAHFSWIRRMSYAGFSEAEFPALARWIREIDAGPATQRAFSHLANPGTP